jgi:hypothetical protein
MIEEVTLFMESKMLLLEILGTPAGASMVSQPRKKFNQTPILERV